MKKKGLIVLLFIYVAFSCSKPGKTNEVFNNFLISQLKFDLGPYNGVKQITEANHFDTLLIFKKKNLLFFEMFDPLNSYILLMNEKGFTKEIRINRNYACNLIYAYNKKDKLEKINGALPYPVRTIIKYDSDVRIKSIYNEADTSRLFEYDNDNKTVLCYDFQLAEHSDGKEIVKGRLIKKYIIEDSENQGYVIKGLNPDNNEELEKYTFNDSRLLKLEYKNGRSLNYAFDEQGNTKKMDLVNPDKTQEIFYFDYIYDENKNWVKRTISLNNIQILITERTIVY